MIIDVTARLDLQAGSGTNKQSILIPTGKPEGEHETVAVYIPDSLRARALKQLRGFVAAGSRRFDIKCESSESPVALLRNTYTGRWYTASSLEWLK